MPLPAQQNRIDHSLWVILLNRMSRLLHLQKLEAALQVGRAELFVEFRVFGKDEHFGDAVGDGDGVGRGGEAGEEFVVQVFEP